MEMQGVIITEASNSDELTLLKEQISNLVKKGETVIHFETETILGGQASLKFISGSDCPVVIERWFNTLEKNNSSFARASVSGDEDPFVLLYRLDNGQKSLDRIDPNENKYLSAVDPKESILSDYHMWEKGIHAITDFSELQEIINEVINSIAVDRSSEQIDGEEEHDTIVSGAIILNLEEQLSEKELKTFVEKTSKKFDVQAFSYDSTSTESGQICIKVSVPHLDGLIIMEELFFLLESKKINFARACIADTNVPSATLFYIEKGEYLESKIDTELSEAWAGVTEEEIDELEEDERTLLREPRKYFFADFNDWKIGISSDLLNTPIFATFDSAISNVVEACESICE
ncbi:MAG: hypothetical protein VX100_16755 [Pseudomonadota bacterium]|nr:hypothetical protein [Pseudomonadota bacterium]